MSTSFAMKKHLTCLKKPFLANNFMPDTLEKDIYYKLSWKFVKWSPFFSEIQAMEGVIDKLFTDECNNDSEFAFKAIFIHENNTTQVLANDAGFNEFDDFYTEIKISENFENFNQDLLK